MTEVEPTDITNADTPNVYEHTLDAGRYLLMMRELEALREAVDEKGSPSDPLLVVTKALLEVVHFLDADPRAHHLELARPFVMLVEALNDKIQGGKSVLLDKARRPTGTTKPTNLFRDVKRGQMVEALNLLVSVGLTPKDAARWLAIEIARRGIRNSDRTRINAEQCLRWRSRVSDGKAPSAQILMAEELRQERTTQPADVATVAAAKRQALLLLKTVSRYDFLITPHESAKQSPASSRQAPHRRDPGREDRDAD